MSDRQTNERATADYWLNDANFQAAVEEALFDDIEGRSRERIVERAGRLSADVRVVEWALRQHGVSLGSHPPSIAYGIGALMTELWMVERYARLIVEARALPGAHRELDRIIGELEAALRRIGKLDERTGSEPEESESR